MRIARTVSSRFFQLPEAQWINLEYYNEFGKNFFRISSSKIFHELFLLQMDRELLLRIWVELWKLRYTAQKMKFFIKDFFSKGGQIRSFLRFWTHLPKKFLMENFIFCALVVRQFVKSFI